MDEYLYYDWFRSWFRRDEPQSYFELLKLPQDILKYQILTKVPYQELLSLCKLNKIFQGYCGDEEIWRIRARNEFRITEKPDSLSWRQYYIRLRESEVTVQIYEHSRLINQMIITYRSNLVDVMNDLELPLDPMTLVIMADENYNPIYLVSTDPGNGTLVVSLQPEITDVNTPGMYNQVNEQFRIFNDVEPSLLLTVRHIYIFPNIRLIMVHRIQQLVSAIASLLLEGPIAIEGVVMTIPEIQSFHHQVRFIASIFLGGRFGKIHDFFSTFLRSKEITGLVFEAYRVRAPNILNTIQQLL